MRRLPASAQGANNLVGRSAYGPRRRRPQRRGSAAHGGSRNRQAETSASAAHVVLAGAGGNRALRALRLVSLPKLGNPKLCFNWDGGSAANACIGATGAYDLKIEIAGIASHAGVHPEGGVSAIAVAGLAIADLQQNGWHGLIVKGKNSGTSNIGVIGGGDATNVVTSSVKLRGEVRSHDARFRSRLVDEFRKAFERAAKAVKNDSGKTGKVRFQADLKYESFRIAESEATVQKALRAIRAVGLKPQTRISNGGLDANWLSARGLPTVTLGSGQQNVHTVNETLNVEDFLNGCRIGLLLATGA